MMIDLIQGFVKALERTSRTLPAPMAAASATSER
jgi:hypothetical protein